LYVGRRANSCVEKVLEIGIGGTRNDLKTKLVFNE
jgi:hypothetical protein